MSKPKGEKCDTCYVRNNRLRCSLCKWKTTEWFLENPSPVVADNDLWSETKQNEYGDTE